jgi:hypothetical protein
MQTQRSNVKLPESNFHGFRSRDSLMQYFANATVTPGV